MAWMTVYHGGYQVVDKHDDNSSVYYENTNYIFERKKKKEML